MQTLVTYGSKMGGTAGIARTLTEALQSAGVEAELREASQVDSLEGFDAVILGGALYANRWPAQARRFARRHEAALRTRPVWVFSSGPLDDSAERSDIPPSHQVAVICERIGALEHVTFGGYLAPDAKGFPAQAMAQKLSGDYRNPEAIRRWAGKIAERLPSAQPGAHVDHPAHSLGRQLGYGVLTWAAGAGLLVGLRGLGNARAGVVVYAVMAPLLAALFAWLYFRARGSRAPLSTAALWTLLAAALDVAVLAPAVVELRLFTNLAIGVWPLLATFAVTLGVGGLLSTLPWPPADREPSAPRPGDAEPQS